MPSAFSCLTSKMPLTLRTKVKVNAYMWKFNAWAASGFKAAPEDKAINPHWKGFGSELDETTTKFQLLLDHINDMHIDEDQHHIRIFHCSIDGAEVRPDALIGELRDREEILVYFEVNLPEYD